MEKCSFKLKEGKRVALHGLSEVITNANLTDAKAEMLLKKYPSLIKLFDVVPDKFGKPTTASVEPEPMVDDVLDVEKIKRDNLESKSLQELKAIAENLEVPESIYSRMKKRELFEFILEKTK